MLEAIFDNCFSRWGGRFNLIIPCEDGEVRPAYFPWLEAYDPDIIYCYVDLSDSIIDRLHERLYPSFLVRHNFYNRAERDRQAFLPNLPIDGLSSLSVTMNAARGNALAEAHPVTLIDTHLGSTPTPLIQENFGCYCRRGSGPWPMAPDMVQYVQTLTMVPDHIRADPRLVPRARGEIVNSEIELLRELSKRRTLVGLALLSAWQCPRLEIRHPPWTGNVNLMVGDSFADRITFWNARSLQPVWLDGSIVTLKISPADVDQPDIFAAILEIIKNRIHVRPGSSNNSITVRSASLALDQLGEIQNKFRASDQWNIYTFAKLDSIDACAPDGLALSQAMRDVEDGPPFARSDRHEVVFSEDTFRPPVVAPRHLREIRPLPSGVSGAWALELDIERVTDYSRFQNVQHRWRLPRRLRMTSAFTRAYQLGGNFGPYCVPRVNDQGLLTLFGTIEGQLPELNAPTDQRAFRFALCMQRDWMPFAPGHGPLQNSLAYDIRPSDKGRYLSALMNLSDGIHRGREIFLNKFWKEQFETLGATPSANEDRLPELVQTLKKRLKSGAIADDDEWLRVAKQVIAEARKLRLAPRYLRFDHLSKSFDSYRNDYWSVNQPATPREEWDDEERRSLSESVKYLCQREVFHQGHEWLCPRCNNNNWVSIDALKKSMVCDVCGTATPAPVAEAWRFKLNSFVLEGLRDHGMLAYLWCLSRLSDLAHASFYFLEPHELFFTTDSRHRGKPDAEIDLIVIADGVVRLCEIKTSNRDIEVEKLAKLARQLRPDIATLAIMEPGAEPANHRLAELRKLLDGSDIESEIITLEDQDIDESPHLPTGRSYFVRIL